jgi:hypothetical protein
MKTRFVIRRYAVLRQHRVTVVLEEFLDQLLDFAPLLQRMNIPFVVQGHGIDLSAKLRLPAVASASELDRHSVVSHFRA